MNKSKIIKLLVSIALPIGLGAIAGIFTAEAVPNWYATLNQPSFNPPNWVFGPVWSALYVILGISFFMIWNTPQNRRRNIAISVFLFQLLLNFGWSFLFFYFHIIGIALIEIIFLWINILTMMILFYRIKPLTAYLNIPYLLWVSFASILNAAYFILNS